MNRRIPRVHMSRKAFFIAVGIFLLLAILVVASNIAYLVHSNAEAGHRVIVAAAPDKVYSVPPPPVVPSAELVAANVHCTKFQNIAVGGGVQGLVLDEGSCYIGSTKYAIDTFQSKASRNLWLKMATPYGVVPKWETAHAVVYKSVTG